MSLPDRFVHRAFWILLGLAIAATGLALAGSGPWAQDQPATATPAAQATVEGARQEIGSTDGIVFMAVVIVLVVVLPILLRSKTWSNGGRSGQGEGANGGAA